MLHESVKNPARFPWDEAKKVDHYYLSVYALMLPMQVQDEPGSYGGKQRSGRRAAPLYPSSKLKMQFFISAVKRSCWMPTSRDFTAFRQRFSTKP